MRSIRKVCLPLLLFALSLLAGAATSATEFSSMTLSGLRSVAVEITGVKPDFARFGLTTETLYEVARARLEAAGLDVVSLQEARNSDESALLTIKLTANRTDYYYYSYSLNLQVKDKVSLPNRNDAFVSQVVWSTGRNSIIMPTDMRRLNGYVDEMLTVFVSDYARQNPTSLSSARP